MLTSFNFFCRKHMIGFKVKHIPILQQFLVLEFPFQYTLSPIPVLQNPNFPPK